MLPVACSNLDGDSIIMDGILSILTTIFLIGIPWGIWGGE